MRKVFMPMQGEARKWVERLLAPVVLSGFEKYVTPLIVTIDAWHTGLMSVLSYEIGPNVAPLSCETDTPRPRVLDAVCRMLTITEPLESCVIVASSILRSNQSKS